MTSKLVALAIGVGFGFVLSWSGVTNPSVIRDMLLLREAHVFLLMGSAIAVAAVGVRLLRALRLRSFVTHEPINWTPASIESRHVVGSAMFGAGWSVACTCPGPVAAMIGQGQVVGLIVGAGLISGIAIKQQLDARRVTASRVAEPPVL